MSHNGGLLQGVDQTRLLAILMSVSLEHVLGIPSVYRTKNVTDTRDRYFWCEHYSSAHSAAMSL